MKKTALLAAAAVVALSAGSAMAAGAKHPAMSTKGLAHTQAKPFHKVGPMDVLYDQNSNDSGIGIVSQNFESSFDQYDAQAADDFKVPHGSKWHVSEVDVSGVYFNGSGPAVSENVTFYHKGAHGLPGDLYKEFDGLAGTDNGFGSFTIALPQAVRFHSGTWWVSVQVNMDFAAGGEWGWENRIDVIGKPAAWVNAGDGFATGCTTYQHETSCIADGQGDHMFTLQGTSN
jgi:hypothetical protein